MHPRANPDVSRHRCNPSLCLRTARSVRGVLILNAASPVGFSAGDATIQPWIAHEYRCICIVCFSSLTGFLGYASLDGVNWGFILPAAVASLVGGQIGARLMSTKLQGRHVRMLFSLVLFAFCAKLLQQFFA